MVVQSEEDLIGVAAQLKAKLLKRSSTMAGMIERMAKSDSGLIRRLNPEVYETIVRDLKLLTEANVRDTMIYATLRWVLCITDGIEFDNLELDD